MELQDMARRLPDDLWEIFAPLLPPVVWCGHGRPPQSHKDCVHGLLSVVVAGIAWERLPPCWPASTTIQRRLHRWRQRDVLRPAWGQRAQPSEPLPGIPWEQRLLDGSQQPAQKGGKRRGLRRWLAPRVAQPGPERATHAPCREAWSSPRPTPTPVGRRRRGAQGW